MAKDFIVTTEHRRFKEFATAVRKEHTIGICHGDAGIGKTLSARRYADWDTLGAYIDEWGRRNRRRRETSRHRKPDSHSVLHSRSPAPA